MDYRDLNRVCPKDNYPTPLIYQIIDECVESEIFSFVDGFSITTRSTSLGRPRKDSFYLSVGYVHVQKAPFQPQKCWGYISVGNFLCIS